MKTLLSLTVAALLALTASFTTESQDTDLTWHSDLEAATRLAEESGRLMLVVFR